MLIYDFLKKSGNTQEYSRKSIILLFAYFLRQYKGIIEFTVNDIKECFREAPLKIPTDLVSILKEMVKGRNSNLMSGSTKNTYSLTLPGLNEVEAYLSLKESPENEIDTILRSTIPYLGKIISKVSEKNQRNYLSEAISCLGVDSKRATIIMIWAAVVSHLYDFILADPLKLTEFNQALQKRSDRHSKIKICKYDDFGDLPESIFIEVCRSANIINNDIRKILDEKIGIRNTCAHPSAIEIPKTKVVNFIEDLIENVIIKYKIS